MGHPVMSFKRQGYFKGFGRMESKNWIDEARKAREMEAVPRYGPINPQTDKRCFIKEAQDELFDSLNYLE